MNNIRIFVLYFLISLFFLNTGYAQQKRKFNPLTDDITQIVPPMSTLIDSAFAHDPGLKFAQLQYSIDKGNLRTSQTQWTQDLGLQANGGYGTFDYLYNNSIG